MNEFPKRIEALSPEKRRLLEAILEERGQSTATGQTIHRRQGNNAAPLSFTQQRLWFLDQLDPGNSAYNIPDAVRLRGKLDVEALTRALSEIVRRHEILRTTFPALEGQPIQRIAAPQAVTLPVVDLGSLAEEMREAELTRRVQAEAEQPFDLARGPLLRVSLVRLAEQDHVLILIMHHIICDGWSRGMVIRKELSTLYTALASGQPSPLPELPIQYADYAVWQRNSMRGPVLEQHLAYWRDQLRAPLPVLALPTDRPRPALQTFRGATHTFTLSPALTTELQRLSRREGVTLFMTLFAAFSSLLHRYSRQVDIIVGTPIANRNLLETEGLIGYFANTLLLRIDLSNNPSFKELLSRIRSTALAAYKHQDITIEQIVADLQPERHLSRNPLFQTLFSLQNAPMPSLEISGIEWSSWPVDSGGSRFDLTLDLWEDSSKITGVFEYNVDLFDQHTILRMERHYQIVLKNIIDDLNQSVSNFIILSLEDQRQQILDWQGKQRKNTAGECLHVIFERVAEKFPDKIALVCDDERLTYMELNQRSNQIANYLKRVGVGPEVRVGICVNRSIEMIVILLGILKAGGAYVPLNPTHPQERLAFIAQDTQMPILVTQQKFIKLFPIQQTEILLIDAIWDIISQEAKENINTTATPDNLAYVIYTSGSTGLPKGVEVPHRGVVNLFEVVQELIPIDYNSTWAVFHSYGFDFSVWEMFAPLLHGGCLVIVPQMATQSSTKLYDLVHRVQVSVLGQTPSALRQLLSIMDTSSRKATDLGLKLLVCGGEALPRDLAVQLLEWNIPIWNFYGPTEASVWTTAHRVLIDDLKQETVSIGRPFTNLNAYLLDPHLQLVPQGVLAELYIGGEGLARGYLNRPDLTAERFVPNPYSTRAGARLYRTGDQARYRSDGTIEFVGRIDQQVKLRGFRIELGEVEAVLGAHASIGQAVVMVREDVPGDKRLTAYVVAKPGASVPTADVLRNHLRTKLPDYMIPSAIVSLEALPLTPNGKLDRKGLPVPASDPSASGQTYVAPHTPLQEMLASIWADVLRLERCGIHDNFFELGGHSLLATQVISRIRETFRLEIPVRSLFQTSTIAEFAELVSTMMAAQEGLQVERINSVPRNKELPLSFAQQRLWFLDQLDPGNSAYNIPNAVRLRGKLDVEALTRALSEIVRRHEILRTTFPAPEGQPIQRIATPQAVSLPVVDLGSLAEEMREAELTRRVQAEAEQPFDLAQGPLLHVSLVRLAEQDHVLILIMHHIICDGWSMGILIKEALELYTALASGQPSPLPELPIQYADYAVWQRNSMRGPVLEQHLAYWRDQLRAPLPVLALPTDRPRPALQSFRGATHTFTLSPALTVELQRLSRREGVTLFMTLFAAFSSLLHRYSGQDDIIVGTDIANRNRHETESLIGFFVNQLVLRIDLSGNPSFREILQRVRAVSLGAYVHQELPFDQLVQALNPTRSLDRAPLFQVKVVSQNVPRVPLEIPGLIIIPVGFEVETTQLDVILVIKETGQGLLLSLEYNTDLFNKHTIIHIVEQFEAFLQRMTAQPETRLGNLEVLTAINRRKQMTEQNNRKGPGSKSLRDLKPKKVSLPQGDLVRTGLLMEGPTSPLVIQPDTPFVDIVDWVKSHTEFIEANLLQHGAILFRGFTMELPKTFEQFALTVCPELYSDNGEHPREVMGSGIYTPVYYPANRKLLWHNENSFNYSWPTRILFCCSQPAREGGETPIADCRQVFERLSPVIKKKFMDKNIMYLRNYGEGLGLSWEEVFQTNDRLEVENYCRQNRIEFEWKEGNSLRTRCVRPTVLKHPKTGQMSWFNQAQIWHINSLDPDTRSSLTSLFREEDLPRHCYYGDGSPIEEAVIDEICATYQQLEASFPWQPMDILLLDNIMMAHGRNPFVGERKQLVAMGGMSTFDDLGIQ